MRELVRLVEEPRTCSYLPEQTATLEYRIVEGLGVSEYEDLLARGYRRFGRQLFRPQCPACNQCVSIRVLPGEFAPSAGQRRVLRRNQDVQAVMERVRALPDHVELYNRYHRFMADHRGWRPDRIDRLEYHESFVSGGGDFARQWSFRRQGRLLGVALMDETPNAVSLIYFFHEPDWRRDSPGIFSILKQLEYARWRGKRYAYPGYWIAANQSMAYKAKFRPFERLRRHPPAHESPEWVRSSE